MTSGGQQHIWVTRLLDRVSDHAFDAPILMGFLTLGVVPILLTVAFLGLIGGASPQFLIAHLLAATVPVLGVPGIWYWDRRVYPRFVDQTAELAVDVAALRSSAREYKATFAQRWWPFTAFWTLLVVAIIGLNLPYFETIGVTGPADPAFLVYLLFAAWWGVITGIGFHGAITAIRAIRAVGNHDLDIDPLTPDGLGGLSNVGTLAIWTTTLISIGSLTLPLAFLLAAEGGFRSLIYVAVGLYVVVIGLSFVYPTIYVNRRAQAVREDELEERRAKIRRLQEKAADVESVADGDDDASMEDLATRLEIQRLREEYTAYANVNLYPLSIGIVVRLVSSLLLPIFFILVEKYMGAIV